MREGRARAAYARTVENQRAPARDYTPPTAMVTEALRSSFAVQLNTSRWWKDGKAVDEARRSRGGVVAGVHEAELWAARASRVSRALNAFGEMLTPRDNTGVTRPSAAASASREYLSRPCVLLPGLGARCPIEFGKRDHEEVSPHLPMLSALMTPGIPVVTRGR